MDRASAQTRLTEVVRALGAEKRSELERLKEGASGLDRSDFIWHYLLQSFSTMGGVRGRHGLIENQVNYRRVTYDTLATLTPEAREAQIREVCRAAKVNYPDRKAAFIFGCFKYVERLGGLEASEVESRLGVLGATESRSIGCS